MEFHKSKNHESLSVKIHKTMVTDGILVSKTQVMNEWINIEKMYLGEGDANNKTGNSKTTWEYEYDFDDLFVYKGSTQADYSADSGISLLILNGGKSHSRSKIENDTLKALLLFV